MSGGSHNYVCYKIEEYLVGNMYDKELDDLMKDIVELAHDLEWMDSGDSSVYPETVKKFKKKWFKSNRTERLKGYIDETISDTKKQLYAMIGETDDDD